MPPSCFGTRSQGSPCRRLKRAVVRPCRPADLLDGLGKRTIDNDVNAGNPACHRPGRPRRPRLPAACPCAPVEHSANRSLRESKKPRLMKTETVSICWIITASRIVRISSFEFLAVSDGVVLHLRVKVAAPLIRGRDVPPRYRVDCVASRRVLARERFRPFSLSKRRRFAECPLCHERTIRPPLRVRALSARPPYLRPHN
jgi:hypothetical protein